LSVGWLIIAAGVAEAVAWEGRTTLLASSSSASTAQSA